MLNHESINQTVLGKIVADKLVWVEKRKQQQPLESFAQDLKPSDRDFTAALDQPQAVFILECKKASPSKGLIRPDFDPAAIATISTPNGIRPRRYLNSFRGEPAITKFD